MEAAKSFYNKIKMPSAMRAMLYDDEEPEPVEEEVKESPEDAAATADAPALRKPEGNCFGFCQKPANL